MLVVNDVCGQQRKFGRRLHLVSTSLGPSCWPMNFCFSVLAWHVPISASLVGTDSEHTSMDSVPR